MLLLKTSEQNFQVQFDALLRRGNMDMDNVSKIVSTIIAEIKADGNGALKNHIEKFDKWHVANDEALEVKTSDMKKAYDALDVKLKEALELAYKRIYTYHEKLMPKSWLDFEENGTVLGQKVTPVDRAGLYIPGGKAAYPSSLLMNAIPALVAGVKEVVVCTPAPNNELNPLLLAAMHLCGIKKAFKVGGASAIAAMAYGTQSIPKVDVITGPGNIFVATAKKLVFGEVNIDMIAGPSEIGVLADTTANPHLLAIDLLSQAEHDEMASSILITPSLEIAEKTRTEIYMWLETLDRKAIAEVSIKERGAIIVTRDMDEAVNLMNQIAPEHLEVVTSHPFDLLPKIHHAGAIFMGSYTPEPIGDYIAGPNHTLPTGGTAKFYSPLGVENFLKRSSIISMSKQGIDEIGEACALLAHTEGLGAHEASVRVRLSQSKK
ncbi:histidinol dehydrogenase [Sulfurospirillum diekertiae]|uniref:Histidinol dehydrogenase n=1 Tax=Sulfurospirillum diekertiae TaxID=1854492 RepID=A0A6G9VNF7_9BACT|nr:histidinol dehydrogenase [Sulfurospirillum diekertiae]QIR74875.1 histidinol dehydrogenase [Sulfurospirillum diekertiae]QIR77539.1 histidinol dehydrogenase [Sulfurospirillum diekertiae]